MAAPLFDIINLDLPNAGRTLELATHDAMGNPLMCWDSDRGGLCENVQISDIRLNNSQQIIVNVRGPVHSTVLFSASQFLADKGGPVPVVEFEFYGGQGPSASRLLTATWSPNAFASSGGTIFQMSGVLMSAWWVTAKLIGPNASTQANLGMRFLAQALQGGILARFAGPNTVVVP